MYKITIEKFIGTKESGYREWETAYEQILDNLDLSKVVVFLNSAESKSIDEKLTK